MAAFVTGFAAVVHESRDFHMANHVNDMGDQGLPRHPSLINAQVYEKVTPSFRLLTVRQLKHDRLPSHDQSARQDQIYEPKIWSMTSAPRVRAGTIWCR